MGLSMDSADADWKNNLLRNIDVQKIFTLIDKYKITHFGGAPIVLNMITGAPENLKKIESQSFCFNCWSTTSKYYL